MTVQYEKFLLEEVGATRSQTKKILTGGRQAFENKLLFLSALFCFSCLLPPFLFLSSGAGWLEGV